MCAFGIEGEREREKERERERDVDPIYLHPKTEIGKKTFFLVTWAKGKIASIQAKPKA